MMNMIENEEINSEGKEQNLIEKVEEGKIVEEEEMIGQIGRPNLH
jgi:hypothetical protein